MREYFHYWSAAALIGLLAAGCGESDSAEDETAVRALAPYAAGTWQAAEPLYRNDAFNPVAEAVRVMRPEYSVQEIKDFLAAPADVDYTSLLIEGQSIRFSNSATVLCAGQYSPREAHEPRDGGSHDHEAQAFDLVATTGGDCSQYALLEIGAVEMHGPQPHFHISHGTASGPLHPAPWSPAVWPTEMTPAQFAEAALAAVPFFASSLPPR